MKEFQFLGKLSLYVSDKILLLVRFFSPPMKIVHKTPKHQTKIKHLQEIYNFIQQ